MTVKRMDRLMAILIALQQEPATAKRLADKFEVTKRTILRDMQSLAEMGIPLYAVSGPLGGFRLMESFRLPPLQLDSGEALSVLFALRSLTRMADTPFQQARWTVMDKLKAIMPEQTLAHIESMLDYVEVEVPQRSVKSPFLSNLLAYTADSSWLRVLYRSEKQIRWLELWPRKMYAAHGYWYCEAYSIAHGEQRTFRVDRFEAIELMEVPGEEAVRLAREAERAVDEEEGSTRIIAELTYRGALLAEQDFHIGDSVKQVSDERWELDFMCPASEWQWAVKFFYGLGMDAEVKEPRHLREELLRVAREVYDRYSQGKTDE
ncbi:YafY family protein [Paenibacillus sp. BC26]|uniref:helix-turn-helix transcriptional regulator n=1 Tax=Paenibacillus sp. BC26 TaxID=1881032 RepID=UPI0008EFEF30|nr:WYL domain-containing protein [Paenibacillus sp. BC26]SFT14020.1 Predicted DNA-binding transcriptional regulator YafY, contains an HTH and WYL domains [Paenibacillus sp. BC26]